MGHVGHDSCRIMSSRGSWSHRMCALCLWAPLVLAPRYISVRIHPSRFQLGSDVSCTV